MNTLFEKGPDQSLLTDEIIAEFRERFAEKLEDVVTSPDLYGVGFPTDLPDKIRRGEKIESGQIIKGAFSVVGQDLRLTPEQKDRLKEIFFEQ